VRRESCPADGRGQIVRIKPADRSLLKRMWPVYEATTQRALGDRLNGEEAGILAALLGKLYKSGNDDG
jgi:DNA-binding MarR family transcriptional regulator